MTELLERRLLRRLSEANRAHELVEAGDEVMVCLSGGKDSWALLGLLVAYRRMLPFDFDIVAVNLDQGHPGFEQKIIADHCDSLGIRHHMVAADTYSVVLENTPVGKTYCSLCSRLRRGILYDVAEALGATKIALALPSRLPLVEIDAVIAPEGDRASALTLEPIVAVTGLTPEASAHEQGALVDQIRDHHQQTVLVIAHPLEMQALVAALGVPADELPALKGDLVEVRVDGTSAKARAVPLD